MNPDVRVAVALTQACATLNRAAAGDLKRQVRKALERGVHFKEPTIWGYFSQVRVRASRASSLLSPFFASIHHFVPRANILTTCPACHGLFSFTADGLIVTRVSDDGRENSSYLKIPDAAGRPKSTRGGALLHVAVRFF